MILALIFAGVMFLIYKAVTRNQSNKFVQTPLKPPKGYTNVSIPDKVLQSENADEFLFNYISHEIIKKSKKLIKHFLKST